MEIQAQEALGKTDDRDLSVMKPMQVLHSKIGIMYVCDKKPSSSEDSLKTLILFNDLSKLIIGHIFLICTSVGYLKYSLV